ncbi:MAG TPA: FecR family protein [Candidatus Binatia bacterium]|nr:FecR family protein [Candidatus Binatia bacterium]
MKKASHFTWFTALLATLALALPPGLAAQGQSAGQISRLIPTVNLQHGTRVQLASAGAKVLWGDMVTTDRGGRARITLDDGSILNVGSESSLRIVQHDAANQRTQVQLAYGRLRASAVRLARAGSSFEVRTPTAVAGVVGTDFVLDFTNNMTSIHVYEGSVNFCNLGGQCVTVGAGFTSISRGNQPPSQPSPTPPSVSTESVQNTAVGSSGGAGGGGAAAAGAVAGVSHSALIIGAVIAAVVVPAVAVPAVVSTQPKKCGCTTVP